MIKRLELKFLSEPVQNRVLKDTDMSKKGKILVGQKMQELLRKGAIINHTNQCQQPFSEGKRRWVVLLVFVNLKSLNQFLPYHHFKMEGFCQVNELLKKGDFMVKLDLQGAYFSVPLQRRFQWDGKLL